MTIKFRQSLSVVLALLFLSFAAFAQKEYPIAEIQGDKGKSSHENESVHVTGVVTAILKNGFYVQTPDAQADKNPLTSEGIYVFGSESTGLVAIGDMVQVDATVSEYTPRGARVFFSITELTKPSVKVISKNSPLPAPVVLTASDLDPKGKIDQMERFEGMRVSADVAVVGPTTGYTNEKTGIATSNGVFFTTLQSNPRPFREPGVDTITAIVEKLPSTMQRFDTNPEILRVDSDAQIGSKAIDVPAGATIKNLTGVIDYYQKFYTLMVDAKNPPTIENVKGFVPVSAAGTHEVTVGCFNIENFFDDETNSKNVEKETVLPKEIFQNRLNKVSLAIRNVLQMPDVLGIEEVENLKVLQKVADKINADAVAAGKPDPKYVAYLEEGNDMRGIDVGFLVKSTKIKIVETKQLAKDEKLDTPAAGVDAKLFDRTPLLLRAEVTDETTKTTFAFTIIVNHLKSYIGVDGKDGDRIRNKRRLEAEWLANFVQERQKANPAERLIVCGDFNSFQFSDGYNDLIGILKGKPDPNVLAPSKTVFDTGLIDLVERIDLKNRYSYTYDGSAQAIDHILINKPTRERVLKFGFARLDADFPLVYSNDPTRPERVSDHDAPIVFLSLDPPGRVPMAGGQTVQTPLTKVPAGEPPAPPPPLPTPKPFVPPPTSMPTP